VVQAAAVVQSAVRGPACAGRRQQLTKVRDRFGATVEAVTLDFTDPGTRTAAHTEVQRMFLLRPPQLGKPRTQMLLTSVHQGARVRQMVFLSLQSGTATRGRVRWSV